MQLFFVDFNPFIKVKFSFIYHLLCLYPALFIVLFIHLLNSHMQILAYYQYTFLSLVQ